MVPGTGAFENNRRAPAGSQCEAPCLIGLDVGSTTVKAVVMHAGSDRVLWKDYQRHESRQAETVLDFLRRIERDTSSGEAGFRIFVTGSGAASLVPQLGAKLVQEVNAIALAVERYYPQAGSVIELGGQDAKIIIWSDDPRTGQKRKLASMNDKCAGGTGAVIDKIAAKLGLTSAALQALTYSGVKLHPVAARCGVFAETDINSLQKQGVPAVELMASLFQAIVQQNLGVLTRGHTVRPTVLLLGGPNSFFPALCDAWRYNITRLWETRNFPVQGGVAPQALIILPEDAVYFAARGAALYGEHEERDAARFTGTAALAQYVARSHDGIRVGTNADGLVHSAAELDIFKQRFARQPFAPPRLNRGETVEAYVGIDAGSTSTKGVVIDSDARLLAKAYQLSNGSPIHDTQEILAALHQQVSVQGATLVVKALGVTGYAKDLLKGAIGADISIVETVAHTRSALHYYDVADVIVDVGGQDIKVIMLDGGRVKDFKLNTQCSAGNGYFLQAIAAKFGYDVAAYADVAFRARRMPSFHYGCAVFLESDIVNFQQLGWTRAEIMAGLAAVLPKNIWLYVVQEPNLCKLGRRFILQGGTQYNLAAVKAQVDFIMARVPNADVVVHEYCGESGAIGAALEAAEAVGHGRSNFIGFAAAALLSFSTVRDESTRCRFCKNRCLRTFIDTAVAGGDRRRFIVASCDKGTVEHVDDMRVVSARWREVQEANPNFAVIAARAAFKPQGAERVPVRRLARRRRSEQTRARLHIGMPRVLDLYSTAPFFRAYFESLGIAPRNLLFSECTDERRWQDGARRGCIDPCFPSKIALAHVHWLLCSAPQKPDVIFFPALATLATELDHAVDSAACPSVSATPEVVKAAFTTEEDLFAKNGVTYCDPVLNMAEPALLERQLLACFGPLLALTRAENAFAVRQGYQALARGRAILRARAREVLDQLERQRRVGLVVLGRPYHNDPGVNHGILDEIQKLGYPIFTIDALPTDADVLGRLFGDDIAAGVIRTPFDITDVWKNAYSENSSRKLWAAKYVARHPYLVAIDLSSFKCGHDAPIYDVVQAIVAASGTPYFTFHDIDENRPHGSIKVRVETIAYFLRQYEARLRGDRDAVRCSGRTATAHFRRSPELPFTRAQRAGVTVLFSGLTQTHDDLVQAALQHLGYRVQYLPVPDNGALATGKEYCNRGQCNPTYYTVGNLVRHLQALRAAGESDIEGRYVLLTAGSCGPCRFGMYEAEYRKALRDAGFPRFRVILFQQTVGVDQSQVFTTSAVDDGVRVDAQTVVPCLRAVVAADLIKAVAHRIRPYERTAGATDRVLADAREILAQAFREQRSVWQALRRARQRFDTIDGDLTLAKPKVKITGEFWAQTTEGDASYHLPSWLEAEGAEVVTEPIAAWIDYLLWCAITNARDRSGIERDARKKLLGLYAAAALFRGAHTFYRAALGFRTAPLPSQRMLARYARAYYNPRIVGGEGHLEVAQHIRAAVDRQAHMVISIKPFGCLPSTQSDGVQSRVGADFTDSLFIPIETSGDGEVNVRSRLQMTLFEAKARARDEVRGALQQHGVTIEAVRQYARCHAHLMRPLQRLPHHYAGTAANFIAKVARAVR